MTWAGNIRHTAAEQALFDDPRSLSLSDPEFIKETAPLRAVEGLPPVSPVAPPAAAAP
jgi:hypothetical protein